MIGQFPRYEVRILPIEQQQGAFVFGLFDMATCKFVTGVGPFSERRDALKKARDHNRAYERAME